MTRWQTGKGEGDCPAIYTESQRVRAWHTGNGPPPRHTYAWACCRLRVDAVLSTQRDGGWKEVWGVMSWAAGQCLGAGTLSGSHGGRGGGGGLTLPEGMG